MCRMRLLLRTEALVKHVEKITETAEALFNQNLCPDCRRTAWAARIACIEPDFSLSPAKEERRVLGHERGEAFSNES